MSTFYEANGELPELYLQSTKSSYTLAELYSYLNGINPETIVCNRGFGFKS